MPRFSIYSNPSGKGYLLDVQAETMSHFNTRMMVPLLPLPEAPTPARTLNPVFDINGQPCSMVTQYMAAVPLKVLKNPILDASTRRNEIVAAIDLLLQGF